ncbi:helicase SWR1 [Coprinopsis cinerea okayama7|uniref:DNA helicase n=1 Tax=Coprinopsis cinerea (strain Okayama-7 / 130 / ATCC MYA-4618 / FGSC 9003) TaxID=240176 RepID=A8N587_COPC7|nr:helicase SWR1 [Coprinopsis cinerea okayama7\|eukprot:XP_001830032.2 helicase SWR1 [Coprinopsis cinerea okayama7\
MHPVGRDECLEVEPGSSNNMGGGQDVGRSLVPGDPIANETLTTSVANEKDLAEFSVTNEMLEAEKALILSKKETERDQVFNRHDDLVREKFHMDNYRNMLTYHPSAAKEDDSRVFQEYKASFDLVGMIQPTAGPSRQTRRTINERKKLVNAFAPMPSSSSSAAPPRPTKRKLVPDVHVQNREIFDILNDALGKGKGKEVAPEPSQPTPKRMKTAPPSELVAQKSPSLSRSSSPLTDLDEELTIIIPRRKPPAGPKPVDKDKGPRLNGKEKKAKMKKAAIVIDENYDGVEAPLLESRAKTTKGDKPNQVPISPKPRPQPISPVLGDPPGCSLVPDTTEGPSKSLPNKTIKRIKLVVRKPSRTYTNPAQIPLPPKHGGSLSALLATYRTNGLKEIVDEKAYQRKIKKEAEIRNRELLFRRQQRFIPGKDVYFGTRLDEDDSNPAYEPPKRTTTDHWDDVVEAAVLNGKARLGKRIPVGRQVAGQVAARIRAYWDAQEAKKERARLQEEKRLRTLAKSTIKLVVAEWKKAVFHIREKRRLEEEEEERRLGQEHLNAILEQSGHILSTQQRHLIQGVTMLQGGQGSDDEDGEGALGEELSDTDDYVSDGSLPASQIADTDSEGSGDRLGTNLLLMDSDNPQRLRDGIQDGLEDETLIDNILVPDPDKSPVRQSSLAPLEDILLSGSMSSDPITLSPSPNKPIFNHESAPIFGDEYVASALEREDFGIYSPEPLSRPDTPVNGEGPASSRPTSPTSTAMDVDAEPGMTLEEQEEEGIDEEGIVPENPEDSDYSRIPAYLRPYAVAPVDWDPSRTIQPPSLLRGVLRPYQQSGLEWLASLHTNHMNGILADEMGLGKTIQTIALLAHLACDRGIWGPHLIVVPTSVLLNWEMEFKKFLPGFKVVSYHGSPKRRKELRQGWRDKYSFNVCITSYTLASRDQLVFKRKNWYYLILDEAHMIKNFRSQRWNVLLMFRSFRRLLLTGTPLQNNLTELWSLLQFLMSGSDFANLKEFGDWFSNPLEKAIEHGDVDEETMQRVSKLHTVLRPYLLRRLKRDVEKELPSKFEHLVLCPLSKRQRFLYDEFMSRAQTQKDLQSGVYLKIANILMQLRKVCNHPDLFEVRSIVTSFAMSRSAIADYEIKELLVRRRWCEDMEENVNLDVLGLQFIHRQNVSQYAAGRRQELDATSRLPFYGEGIGKAPPKDTRTIAGFRNYARYLERAKAIAHWSHISYLNRLRCSEHPIVSTECISQVHFAKPLLPLSLTDRRHAYLDTVYSVHAAVLSHTDREQQMAGLIDRFAFVTPSVVALDMPRIALAGHCDRILQSPPEFDNILHRAAVKLQIAFPEPSLLQYDCGKLQRLAELLQEKKAGGHRVLIFTQMTRVLDILEVFLNHHGYLYLRLDGATKIEDRQYITERFNADSRIFCFISSSRSGGIGIKTPQTDAKYSLTGADTVIFYDSDFNPQMDRQCEDRIGQIRDVHIYRFVSQYTVEEAMLRKANQKRSLDDLVIQKGEFDWRTLFNKEETALTKALGEYDDAEDAHAAELATREAFELEGADAADFEDGSGPRGGNPGAAKPAGGDENNRAASPPQFEGIVDAAGAGEEDEEEGGTTVDYMVAFVEYDYDFFSDWRI